MKKLLILFLGLITITSCTEDVVTDPSKLEKGAYARFSGNVAKTIDYQSGKVSFEVEDANNNAVSYKIYQISASIGGVDYNPVSTNFVYTLPNKVEIPLNILAQVFGLSSSDLYYGDSFKFYAEVTTSDGKVIRGESPLSTGVPSTNTTSVDLLNSTYGYKQAMQFNLTVACPSYNVTDLIGTYSVTYDEFDEYNTRVPSTHTVQCVTGSTPNTVKFINFSNVGTDLIVTIDPESQSATCSKTKIYSNFYTYGDCFAEGVEGLVFSCIGQMDLKMRYSVGAGTFSGTYSLVFNKI